MILTFYYQFFKFTKIKEYNASIKKNKYKFFIHCKIDNSYVFYLSLNGAENVYSIYKH